MKLLLVISILFCLWTDVRADCRMREECGVFGGFPKNCAYDGPALPILDGLTESEKNSTIEILERRCPYLLYDDDGNRKDDDDILTCCDVVQISGMADSMLMAEGVLGRCPTCLRNFVRQICEMNCSPDQDRFVEVETDSTGSDRPYVVEVNYRVFNDFMIDAHASCSGVIVPQTGMPAINMMCGNAPVCDADAWFGFTGDTANNPLAPVQVNFLRWPTPEDSMNARAMPCNETSDGDFPCSCVDCWDVCPSGSEPYIPDTCTVVSVHCAAFSVGIISFVIFFTIFTILTVREYKRLNRSRNNETARSPQKPNKSRLNKMQQLFKWLFSKIGAFSANNAVLTIMLTSWLAFAMIFGVFRLNLTANPLELWSAPDSRSRAELNYFNSRFGPFYRAAQVYIQIQGLDSFSVDNVTYGPAFKLEAIEEMVKLEDAIINIGRDNGGVTLEQVCYAPLRVRGGEQRLDQCVFMSASVYLGNNRHNINNETYLNQIQNCINNMYSFECMASWGGGSEPEISFGGYEDNILSADTLVLNFPISNFLLASELEPVLEWEQQFLDLLHDYSENWKADFVDVSFGAERSIEDEIERVSQAEAIPIAISYLIMFIYVTISLGNVRYCKTWFVDSKIMVALGSIVIEIIAIVCAMGVMGYAGITLTLLAINVIPFFVLSIGIDNVFLMVNTLHSVEMNLKSYDDYDPNMSFDKKRIFVFSKMMMKVGPSMFVSSITQVTCFAVGTLANFPAVVTFSVFACISLAFLFLFQITTVVALLSLDYKRASQNRFDIFCCIQKKILDDEDPLHSETPHMSLTQKLMEPYAKFLLHWRVKIVVAVVFIIMLSTSIFLIPMIEVGLDQEMSLPQDSYVYKYLQSVNHLLKLGPPVYFILKGGLNFTDIEHQNVVCGGQLCNDDSLYTQVFLAAQHTDITYIARSSNSWLDDYFDWTSLYGACCKYNVTDGSFCQSTDISPECQYCEIKRDETTMGLRVSAEDFNKYIQFFLQDSPTEICNKGGLASYSAGVNYVLDSEGRATIYDTNFMAYHAPLATSHDYISAVRYGYEVSENITAAIKQRTGLDVEVVPYSVFYIYFEQYLTMWVDTFSSLGYCLIGAMVLYLVASGFNVLTTFAVLCTSVMVVVNMMGVMYIWNIPLNAVSCVNLIVSIGIAVEFCSHIGYAFATSTAPPEERVEDAIKSVGATIITGITFTNIPIIVLAFSYTEIIEVFFFRMFFSLVVLGFLHGMIFFPVLLSYLSNLRSK